MTFACLMLGISIIVLLTFICVRPAHNLQKGKYLHFSYSVIVHIITTHSYRNKGSLNGRIPLICKYFWSYGIMIIIELKYMYMYVDNSIDTILDTIDWIEIRFSDDNFYFSAILIILAKIVDWGKSTYLLVFLVKSLLDSLSLVQFALMVFLREKQSWIKYKNSWEFLWRWPLIIQPLACPDKTDNWEG